MRRGTVGISAILPRLRPGRLFLTRDGSVHVAFHLAERRGKPVCMAHRLDRRVKFRKGRVVLKGVRLGEIEALLEKRVDLPEPEDVEGVRRCLGVLRGGQPELAPPPVMSGHESPLAMADAQTPEPRSRGPWLWEDFLRHLRFLQDTGFVDAQERLTPDGRWASRLRLDHPILVAEAIRLGLFQGRPAPVLAGLIAPFVTDREREVFVLARALEEMEDAFDALIAATHGLRGSMEACGFVTPVLQFWPAAVLYLWAKGWSWQELRAAAGLDEGDLVSLISRTGDHLRQVCDLWDTHPRVARTAREALRRIQREPAFYH